MVQDELQEVQRQLKEALGDKKTLTAEKFLLEIERDSLKEDIEAHGQELASATLEVRAPYPTKCPTPCFFFLLNILRN